MLQKEIVRSESLKIYFGIEIKERRTKNIHTKYEDTGSSVLRKSTKDQVTQVPINKKTQRPGECKRVNCYKHLTDKTQSEVRSSTHLSRYVVL